MDKILLTWAIISSFCALLTGILSGLNGKNFDKHLAIWATFPIWLIIMLCIGLFDKITLNVVCKICYEMIFPKNDR